MKSKMYKKCVSRHRNRIRTLFSVLRDTVKTYKPPSLPPQCKMRQWYRQLERTKEQPPKPKMQKETPSVPSQCHADKPSTQIKQTPLSHSIDAKKPFVFLICRHFTHRLTSTLCTIVLTEDVCRRSGRRWGIRWWVTSYSRLLSASMSLCPTSFSLLWWSRIDRWWSISRSINWWRNAVHVVSSLRSIRIDSIDDRRFLSRKVPSSAPSNSPAVVCERFKASLQATAGVDVGKENESEDEAEEAEEDAPFDVHSILLVVNKSPGGRDRECAPCYRSGNPTSRHHGVGGGRSKAC